MAIGAGTRFGPYEIQSPLGAGGMGEVYKARDTRLDRTVAIKILPAALAADPQFRERFEREARTISQLDHANICALYDVGQEHGTSYLVMQYLEGETLAARLQKGALPLAEALKIAHRDRRRARQGAPRGHRPSRSEARQRDADQVGREAARLRPGQDRVRSRRGADRRFCRRRPSASRRRAPSSARFSTWRPSRSKGRTRMRGRTSSRSARSSTRWSPGVRRFRARPRRV